MLSRLLCITLLSSLVLSLCAFGPRLPASAADEESPAPQGFAVEGELRKNVEFWIKIYSQYDSQQGVIHDSKYLDHVYEVLDFRQSSQKPKRAIRESKKKWKNLLLSVHKKQSKPESFTEEEKRIFQLYQDVQEPNKFLNAANRKRLRFQLGQKDKFLEGYIVSSRYMPYMEEIFKSAGLPLELTRLPYVESSFNLNARSKVGASGIWQFMRSTGKLFLTINSDVDERNDPIRATEASAQLLKINFESLKSWPLAVTAYNHGRMGMMRAVRKIGSDRLEDVVNSYRSRSFGFASSNFFACLLAVIEVEKDVERYFGPVQRELPLSFYEIELQESIRLSDLVRFLSLDETEIRPLNPALSSAVLKSRKPVPAGYILRLPLKPGTDKEMAIRLFESGYGQIPKLYKIQGKKRKKRRTQKI